MESVVLAVIREKCSGQCRKWHNPLNTIAQLLLDLVKLRVNKKARKQLFLSGFNSTDSCRANITLSENAPLSKGEIQSTRKHSSKGKRYPSAAPPAAPGCQAPAPRSPHRGVADCSPLTLRPGLS